MKKYLKSTLSDLSGHIQQENKYRNIKSECQMVWKKAIKTIIIRRSRRK